MRPCYFVVALDYVGREQPALYWEELPRAPIRRLVYVQRLDLFPNAEKLVASSLDQLFAVYLRLKRMGKLPPRWEPPPRKQEGSGTEVKAGHREVHPRRYLPDAPISLADHP